LWVIKKEKEMKKNKGLVVGLLSFFALAGVGVGLYFGLRKKTAEQKSEDNVEPLIDGSGGTGVVAPTTSSPFANKTEGDAFRRWMKVNHPEYRFRGDVLDESGSHTNSFILDAYSKYGAAYEASKKPIVSAPSTSTFGTATPVTSDDLFKIANNIASNTGNWFDVAASYLGDNIAFYNFDDAGIKYQIVFYNNGRFIVYKIVNNKTDKIVSRGNYRNLGKVFEITEGFQKGAKIVGTDTNLIGRIKQLVGGYKGFLEAEISNIDPFLEPKMSNYSSRYEF